MRTSTMGTIAAVVMAIAAPAIAVAADPTSFASSAEVKAQIAAMERAMKPGQGFAWQPLVGKDPTAAAIEIWKRPGKPAVHPEEAEYAIVLAGAGTLVSGGTLAAPSTTRPGLVEGARIDGGTTRPLRPGDVLMIPAGTPHWFGITGSRLVLLGTKMRTVG